MTNVRGFNLWLTREQWGFVIDGLIEHAATLRKRKGINSESTADDTLTQVEDTIRAIGDVADAFTDTRTANQHTPLYRHREDHPLE